MVMTDREDKGNKATEPSSANVHKCEPKEACGQTKSDISFPGEQYKKFSASLEAQSLKPKAVEKWISAPLCKISL